MPPKRRKGRKSTEIPEGVSGGLWDMLLSIEGNTAQTSDRVDELEEKVVDLEGKQNTEELAKQVNILSNQVALLGAKLEKCEMKNTSLSNELDQLRAHSMKNNLIFSFDRTSAYSKEAKGENCVALIRDFLCSVMGIEWASEMYIPVAHRLGPRNVKVSRPTIVTFPFRMSSKPL
jgi:hypothetical protein